MPESGSVALKVADPIAIEVAKPLLLTVAAVADEEVQVTDAVMS